MTTPAIELFGDEQLKKNLSGLQFKIRDRIMVKAIRSGLVPIGREAKRLARSQFAGDSITKMVSRKAAKSKQGGLYGKVFIDDKKTDRTIIVEGREVPLSVAANIQEYGRKDGSLAPRPFMRPAADSQKDAAVNRMADKAKIELAKEVAKMKKR